MPKQYSQRKSQRQDPIVIVFSAIFQGIGLIFKVFYRLFFKKGHKKQIIDRQFYYSQWREIETALKKETDPTNYQAIVNADKLLDHLMIDAGFLGNNTGDRLRALENKYDRDLVSLAWSAHKIRNRLVHEVGHQINQNQANQTVANFKKVIFKIIG